MANLFGNYDTDYDLRAVVVCYGGLGAKITEDAVYPTSAVDFEVQPDDGTNKYVLHFDKGKTPPVHAFWSLMMYNKEGCFIENPINRYTMGDRNLLKYNTDSSVDFYFQNISPVKGKENDRLRPLGIVQSYAENVLTDRRVPKRKLDMTCSTKTKIIFGE